MGSLGGNNPPFLRHFGHHLNFFQSFSLHSVPVKEINAPVPQELKAERRQIGKASD
jgi:hypothetical protein